MSQWVDQFENHPLHQRLQTLEGTLTEIEQSEDISPDALDSIERLKQIRTHTVKTLTSSDPILVPVQTLNNLDSYVQQVIAYCEQYKSNKDTGQLRNANSYVDNILPQLGTFPSIQSEAGLESLSESVTSLRRSVGQYRRRVEDERQGLNAPIEEARRDLESLRSDISTEIARLDGVVNEFQKQFSESEDKRRVEFADDEKDRENRFRESQQNRETEMQEYKNKLAERAEALLDSITEHQQSAQELVYVIANTGMVGGYQKTANKERTRAIIWQVIAVVCFFGLIGFTIYASTAVVGSSVSWATFGGRVSVAIACGIVATFAVRQADRHESAERSNRRLELALASVDPYLASLPEKTQHEVKRDLAIRFFREETAEVEQRQDEEISGNSADLIRMLAQALIDVARKPPNSP